MSEMSTLEERAVMAPTMDALQPIRELTIEQKKSATKKVHLRFVDSGWHPEFVGEILSQADFNRMIRALQAGYSRYRRLVALRLKHAQNNPGQGAK